MEPFEIIPVETTTVACDGGDGPLGHPRVYLTLSKDGEIECPYCSRKYVLKEGATGGGPLILTGKAAKSPNLAGIRVA